MLDRIKTLRVRWLGLAVVVISLVLVMILVSGQVAGADDGPRPGRLEPDLVAAGQRGTTTPQGPPPLRQPSSPTAGGDWDGYRVSWPMVISDTDRYRMWYLGYNPGNPDWGHMLGMAESFDGTTWAKSPSNPVLGPGDPGAWDEMYRGQVAVLKDGGEYKLWYTGSDDSENGVWETGHATSTNGTDWNVYAGNPVLTRGPSGSWDEGEADGPGVIKDAGLYKMWYQGCNADWTICSIGYATSTNGIDWIKYSGNPVLTGTGGAWDEDIVLWPRVLENGGAYEMWYYSHGQIGRATSPDGVTWTKYAGNPVISESWDGGIAWGQTVLLEGSTYKMWLNGGSGMSEGIGYAESTEGITWTMSVSNPVLSIGTPGVMIDVNYAHDWVAGRTAPWHTVVITVAGGGGIKATASGQADGGTGFGTWDMTWDPERPNIEPGDVVTASVGAVSTAVNPVGTIDGELDLDANTISGTLHADSFAPLTLTVRCEIWEDNGPSIVITDVAAVGGQFLCDFDDEGWDVQSGDSVMVRYEEPDGDTVINSAEWPWMRVRYANYDEAAGDYEAGHTFWITVTDSVGTLRATAEIETNTDDGWGGDGFYTQDEHWSPARPDIQVGDRVQFASDDGYTNTVRVGDIQGMLNAEDDIISGTVLVDWFTGMLDVECHPWGAPDGAPSKDSTAATDGSSYYSCQWDPDTEWDIEPGQEVAVMYIEPDDGDRVIHTFEEPAPDARVDKWAEGHQVTPGGPVVFTLRYRNEGDATAETILLTDTLPANTTFVDDTLSSGTATVDGNQVSWTLGPLEPDYEEAFQILLTNTALAGDTLTNTADIYTQYDHDDWNDHDEAQIDVATGTPDLYVNKHADPGDPAPGQTFLYRINYGNDGPVASGPVVLTDTLPANTSLVSWESENGYGLWTQEDSDPLVLTAPTVPGYWGDRLLLRLELDGGVAEGTRLTNTVEITTAGDTDPGNNWYQTDNAWVGNPSWGGRVEKRFDWGEVVPDGYIVYNIRARNDGNMATQMVLTDSLPSDVSFSTAWLYDDPLHVPFPPDYQDDEVLVWDLGLVAPGEEHDLAVEVEIEATAGTVLTNCATLAIGDVDEWPQDNEDCVAETVNPPGPNLRVSKDHDWDGNVRLDYRIEVENIGNQTVSGVALTDTYPLGTTFNDWYDDVWWGTSSFNHDSGQRQLTWQFDEIEPSWSSQLRFNVDVDSPGPVQWYTNVVTITTVAGDTNPDDNVYTDVAFTGGEVDRVELDVGGSGIWGEVPQGPITITTPSGTEVLPWDGDFDWNAPAPIMPGDLITVEGATGLYPVVIEVPTPFVASASSITDTVWGQIDHLDQEWIEVDLYDGPAMEVQTDGAGGFSATFDDIPRRGDGEVRYTTEIAYAEVTFHRYFRTLDPVVRAHVGDAFAWGEYEEGHTVWLTVLGNDGSTVRGTADLVTEPIPDWGDFVGWATDHTGPWVLHPSEIRPLDHVHVEIDNGYTNTLQIGTITGHVDVDNDRITGTVDAPWLLPETVRILCHTWGAPESAPNPEYKEDEVLPNGTDEYECSWDDVTEWDVEPGQDIGLSYYEPDDDEVRQTFWAPAPDARVEKWTEGHEVPPGGPVVFAIRYENEGDATAGTILLTDTLPANTSFVDDTLSSGTATVDGDQVSWTLGPLEPGHQEAFQILLTNTATAGERLTNTVDIYTQHDRGDWNNHSETEVDVAAGDPDLYVDKDPDPGDPAPGQTFLYRIHYGNDEPVASGPVVLTDTLPENATLVSWQSENGYGLWTQEDSDPLVLTAPTIPGWWGDTLLLRLALDGGVAEGTRLTNTVEIATSGDMNPGNNWFRTDEVWVGGPRWNGWVDKHFEWGQLVPGGAVEYRISARNAGNMAALTELTDSLPAGVSFSEAWLQNGPVQEPFPPDYQDDTSLTWDLGVLEPGDRVELRVRLDIDGGVDPGTVLENCVYLDVEGDDSCPHSCVQDRVNNAGANLRVSKHHDWYGDDRIHYEIRFENVGTQDLASVLITDTYPVLTTISDWGVGYHRSVTGDDHPAQGQMVFWVEEIERGDSGAIWLDVDLDPSIIGQPGIAFTNTVEAPIPGDIYAADNQDQVTTYSNLGTEVYLGTGWNLLAPNVETHPPTLADTALQEIWNHGGDVPEIYRWLSEADTWEGHGRCLPFNNYDLELGQGYFLRAERDSTWWHQGVPPESPVPVALDPIWTLAGLPHLPCPLTARDLLDDIAGQGGTCNEVYRWDQPLGDWEGFDPGMGGDGFDLTENEGYFVSCAAATSYEPGASGICGALASAAPPEPPAMLPEPDMEPVADPAISDTQVTNHRDVALSITWRTDRPSTGWIEYGEETTLGQSAQDDLGEGIVSQVHHATLTGLDPETTYYYRVHSGQTVDDNGGALYTVTTKKTGMPPIPYLAYGQVETADGQPAVGSLVRVWLVDGDGKSSEPLSTLVDSYGYWSMSLPVDRCKDVDVRLQAIGRRGSQAVLTQPACDVKPAPTVKLTEEGMIPVYLPLITR